jgi:uncharacterized protein (TIGR00255 family)
MTGFGAASARTEKVRVTVELSSVNRKQLDVVLRLPPPLAAHESRVQKIIQERISRGRISGNMQLESANGGAMMQINQPRAEEIVGKLRRAAKKLNLKDDLSASMLLQIPGLLTMPAAEQRPEEFFQTLEKALNAALKKLNAMRLREGKALEADLRQRLQLLEAVLAKVKTRAPRLVPKVRKKLFQGLESAFAEASSCANATADKTAGLKNIAADDRIIKEIALFAERADISEEITRLTSHIKQFRASLRSAEPVGRELDFLAQELFREINTIGSKASDLATTQQVVAFKTELERIREQVQNIE